MTEQNYNYRTSPLFLRNQFEGIGKNQIPVIPKFQVKDDDFVDLRLIGFDKIKSEGRDHFGRMVHFFLYDYKFERVWDNPNVDLEKLKNYRAVLSPDFSMYTEMAPVMQLYNTFRNRWCGAYYASKGMRVVPTVSWGGENTFDFCFDGIEKGSTVAVSTYMVSAHNNHKDQKEFFLKGYNELLRRVEPEKIICYNEPFPEMQGDIVFIDYDLSSWRHMDDDLQSYSPSKYVKYICGVEPLPRNTNIVVKSGYVQPLAECMKGMGSSEGGSWKPSPNRPKDERFLGDPGEMKQTIMDRGELYETKIGEDGRAVMERHWTDHNQPWAHTNPHDHEIKWNDTRGCPDPKGPINYLDGDAPEFKKYIKEKKLMREIIFTNNENLNFESICDFKFCVEHGGEIEFQYNGKTYNITHRQLGEIGISEAYKQETEKLCKNADEVLEYTIEGECLRDIVTKIKVVIRTI